MSDACLVVAEGVILGEPFKVTAYTWKQHPECGVGFDVFLGDRLAVQNAEPEHVIGFVAMQLARALDEQMEPRNGE